MQASAFLHRLGTAFLDLLYTRRCVICERQVAAGRPEAARWLCDECLHSLPLLEAPYCSRCGEPYDGAITGTFQCGNCRNLQLHFEYAVAAYRAEGNMRELIHRFKYQKELHLRGVLAHLLQRALREERLAAATPSTHLLVPIPLHHARQREREYNQSWELCRQLSRQTGLPAVQALRRVRATPPQASLTRRQRLANLRRAFQVHRRIARSGVLQGKTVLLVDDVLTTGSTTSECARVLRQDGGAAVVIVITLARG